MGTFAELLAKTNFSFLEGASHPEEMVQRAHELGYYALGVTDRNGVYGIPRCHVASQSIGLKLIVGAEFQWSSQNLFLLCKNRNGYGNLCEILTGSALEEKCADLFILLPSLGLNEALLPKIKELFNDRVFLVASRFFDGKHRTSLVMAETLSKKFEIPCIASGQPLFHVPSQKKVQDVLTCIRYTKTLKEAGFLLGPNRERYLKPIDTLAQLFKGHHAWLENTVRIAESCQFRLDEIRYEYPHEWLPPGETGNSFLRKLVEEGLSHRYPTGPARKVREQVAHELTLIEELRYADYFLTIWDIVQFARAKGILCQGRGSAANSIVCYVLGITSIDPVRMDLLFERFISRERNEPPDIDIDFEHERREEVIQYIYQRYGRHRAAITAEVICFRRRSALREVGKVFGIPLNEVEKILALTHREDLRQVKVETTHPYLKLAADILGFPRHLGTHVGGFVLCQDALNRNVPIEKAAMEGRTIIQWDKNDLDALGFVRVDILGLGILTCIRKSFQYLKEHYGISMDLATLPPEDPKVYEMICRGDTVGVFQIESRAQMNMLPRLKPKNFFDLVVEISIVRPGPIQGEMVHTYLLRRQGLEKIEYAHPDLEMILKKTYGVPLFQEQIMKMGMQVAGFSGGEADELRRAMGTWRRQGRLREMGEKFRQGLMARGIGEEWASRIFKQIEGFAEYGFPESHAASFAILAYATAYLKYYYPDVFLTALLNSQPMGFYGSQTLIYDAKRHGVAILPVDVNHSTWDNRLEGHRKVRLGFREIKGLAKRTGEAIVTARKSVFSCFHEFVDRLKVSLQGIALTKRDLFLLAGANAFSSLGWERRQAFWEIQALTLSDSHYFSSGDMKVSLPEEAPWEAMCLDFESQGMSLKMHPMAYLRSELTAHSIVSSQALRFIPSKQKVKVGGIVICRQMPKTASGVLFVSLEDEFGFINLVVWRNVYEKFKETLVTQSFLLCEGKIEKAKPGVIHIIAEKVYPLLSKEPDPQIVSHDFH